MTEPRKPACASPAPTNRRHKFKKIVAGNVLVLAGCLVLLEGSAFLLFRFPGKGPREEAARQYFLSRVRGLSQFDKGRGRYDPEVSYTLTPGEARWASLEYDTTVKVNSLGVRDDEDSLDRPEIIVLGDSHAMGWGVQQDETFARVLEQRTGRKVLNMGIASYATARQMILLRRADRSALKYLIVQHCDNDLRENQAFMKDDNTLWVMSNMDFIAWRRQFLPALFAYYPGKYTLEFLPMLFTYYRKAPETPPRPYGREARACLNALVHGGVDLSGVEIIVFDLASWGKNTANFTQELNRLTQAEKWRNLPGVSSIRTLDVSPHLTRQHTYRLDDHLNARGHARVAELLDDLIE